MTPPIRVVIAAGGTGGHLFPAVAVGEAIDALGPAEIIFVGTGRELERRIIGGAGYRLESLSLPPVTGRGVWGAARVLGELPVRLVQALRLLQSVRPAVVLGFGGYPSVLPVLAAWLMRVPRVIQEQNAEVGLANRLLSLFATHVFAAPGAAGFWCSRRRVTHVNNPVRKALDGIRRWSPPGPGEPFRLLVLGGSQGATAVNSAVLAAVGRLQGSRLEVHHQTGANDFDRVANAYRQIPGVPAVVEPFIENMGAAYGNAHLIISRAGAMSAAEIAEAGRPALFVPLPIARSHQRQNVRFLEEAGAALVVEQGEGFDARFAEALAGLMDDAQRLEAMAGAARRSARAGERRSADVVADYVVSCCREVKR